MVPHLSPELSSMASTHKDRLRVLKDLADGFGKVSLNSSAAEEEKKEVAVPRFSDDNQVLPTPHAQRPTSI